MIDLNAFEEKNKKFSYYISKLPYDNEIKGSLNNQEFIRKNPPYYLYYPELFAKAFNYTDREKIELLCFAGFFYYKHLIIHDEINDNNSSKGSIYKLLLIANICQEESIKILTTLFPLNSSFWKLWNKRKMEFSKGIVYDKNPTRIKNFRDFENFANAKSAIGKIAIDALNILSKNRNHSLYNEVLSSHKWFYCGFQILDDIIDFREDIENKQTNIAKIQLEKKLGKDNNYSTPDLEKLLFLKGIAEDLLQKSQFYYSKANDSAIKYKLNLWTEVIKLNIAESIRREVNIKTFIKSIEIRIKLEKECNNKLVEDIIIDKSNDIFYNIGVDAFEHIYNNWKKGYGELQHILFLPRNEGFETEEEFHYADIFQRAIVTDSFFDANTIFKGQLSELIEYEVQYLKSKKISDYPGGWSYLPSIKEVAADADDLGQMLQVFSRNEDKQYIIATCKTPIDTLNENCIHEDGGIETWIIPQNNRTLFQERQYLFNTSKWGTGPDSEVMANYLYGLSLYSIEEYENIIRKGIDYLLKKRAPQGFWVSRWYYGVYYGTYVCLRLIKRITGDYALLKPSGDYIFNNQNEDGGWGNGDKSDPLSTSLALLCLSQIIEYEPIRYGSIIDKAVEYLNKLHQLNKIFIGVPFIKPRTNDPYISKTIVASYVLKAISILIKKNDQDIISMQ
ncbi:MAG: hypothetical protein EHM93_11680 [Bacteroidales bacterium]|nr:MAG: hypothetical protein EHM93_11680 [Bacteroidales bacterium]